MKSRFAILGLIMLFSCEYDYTNFVKVIPDYREKFTGNYSFIIITNNWMMNISHYDTTYYDGFIEKNNNTNDRVYIHFGKKRLVTYGTPPDDSCVGTEYPNPVVNQNGSLFYPEDLDFTGEFVNQDSVKLKMSSGGHGGGIIKYVYGHKR
jgi:hypothetical protein